MSAMTSEPPPRSNDASVMVPLAATTSRELALGVDTSAELDALSVARSSNDAKFSLGAAMGPPFFARGEPASEGTRFEAVLAPPASAAAAAASATATSGFDEAVVVLDGAAPFACVTTLQLNGHEVCRSYDPVARLRLVHADEGVAGMPLDQLCEGDSLVVVVVVRAAGLGIRPELRLVAAGSTSPTVPLRGQALRSANELFRIRFGEHETDVEPLSAAHETLSVPPSADAIEPTPLHGFAALTADNRAKLTELLESLPQSAARTYLDEMARPGVWGDQACIIALANELRIHIRVWQRTAGSDALTEVFAARGGGEASIDLMFHSAGHYDLLIDAADYWPLRACGQTTELMTMLHPS